MASTKVPDAEGGAYEVHGKRYMRVTIGPQQRRTKALPWCTSLEEADERAKVVQGFVNRLREAGETEFVESVVKFGATADAEGLAALGRRVEIIIGGAFERIGAVPIPGTGPTTFRTFAERWTNGELAAQYPDHIDTKASVDDDVERFKKHIFPHVEDVPLTSFTREHADGVMSKLDPALKRGTRRQVAQLINRVLNLAAFTTVIKASPLPRGWLPKAPKAEATAKESLLPSEEAKLLAGRNATGEVVVPLAYRVAYAFLHREGMRKGEAAALTWADVDLAKGLLSLDENKTSRPRSWVLDQGIAHVLERWKKRTPKAKASDLVFPAIKWEKLAPTYRTHCEAVGIDRARLFQKKENKLRLRAHDTRAFFVTAAMFAGRDALWITDRSGHTTLPMLRTYERDVRRWRELGETPVAVDRAIPEVAAANTAANAAASSGSGDTEPPPKPMKVHGRGVEPLRLAAAEPKSAASASFATRASVPRSLGRPRLTVLACRPARTKGSSPPAA